MTDRQPGPYRRAVEKAAETAGAAQVAGDGYVLHSYPDYDTYRNVQTEGNRAKLRMQFVKESHVRLLSEYLTREIGPVSFGICHGTRRGAEQAWFKAHLPGAPTVIGTEISDTANQFPDTIRWDFHDENPNWLGRADFVYSNSWDHAFDPARAFAAWIGSLRPGGRLLLDHTKGQLPEAANALDPFGATWERLLAFLGEFSARGRLLPALDFRKTNRDYRARVAVFERTA
jgi:SAM-dependent methyltransferase